MNTEKITYIQYARKSTEGDDRQVLSIEGQLNDNKQVIDRNNLSVLDTITDSSSAALPYNRPGYTEMIRRIKKGEANGIIVWHIDRIVRNELEEGEFKWLFQTGTIKSIFTPTREYRTGENILLLSIETSMASQYSRDLSVKVKRNTILKNNKGWPSGFAPVGYLNTKFAEHGTNYIIEDPDRFHLIRKAFDLLLSGKYNVLEIVSTMTNDYGLRTRKTKKLGGRPISKTTMYDIFRDPFYCGYFYRKGTRYKGAYKPVITVEEHERVLAILGRGQVSKPHKHEFAFTGLMKCGSCGCSVTASRKIKQIKSSGEFRAYSFYHCTKRRGASACSNKSYTTQREMELLIENELASLVLSPKWKDWAMETIKLDHADEMEKHSNLLKDTIDFERKILSGLDTLIDMRIAGEITEGKYNEKKAEKQMELTRVQNKREKLKASLRDWSEQFNECLNFADNAIQEFSNGDPKLKKSVCESLGWNWILNEKKITFSRREWFFDLIAAKTYFEENKSALELINTFEEYRKSTFFEGAFPFWCGMRDHIRTKSKLSRIRD